MKAILVIDIDDELLDKYEDFYVDYDLRALDKEDDYIDSIRYVEDCPLKPLPQKKNNKDIIIKGKTSEILEARYEGWNDCLDEILGETE